MKINKLNFNVIKKLFISVFAVYSLVACSTTNIVATPQPQVAKVVVINNCDDATSMVKHNHEKIKQAFHAGDANAIGALELQNKAIVRSNMECFPLMQEHMKQMDKNM